MAEAAAVSVGGEGRQGVTTEDRTSPEMKPWRAHNGLTLLRLRVDVRGAAHAPVRRAGDKVVARWNSADGSFAKGWMVQGLGFLCILKSGEVEVIKTDD